MAAVVMAAVVMVVVGALTRRPRVPGPRASHHKGPVVQRAVRDQVVRGAGQAVPPADAVSGPADPRAAEHLDPDLPRPGDLVTVRVTHGAPHHLVADSALDGGPFVVRRTRAGDACVAPQRARRPTRCPRPGGAGRRGSPAP